MKECKSIAVPNNEQMQIGQDPQVRNRFQM
jgi:hypothetical protein